MPEMPEVQAHAERLTRRLRRASRLKRFVPLTFTALKTAVPAPDAAYGSPLRGGRSARQVPARALRPDHVRRPPDAGRPPRSSTPSRRPSRAAGRPASCSTAPPCPALLLTEQGTERRAGVWCVERAAEQTSPPLDKLGPEAATIEADELAGPFAATNMRVHGFLRDQRCVAGIGRRLANEVLPPGARSRRSR